MYPYTSLSTSSNINGKDVVGNRLAAASAGSCFSKSTMLRDPRDSVGLQMSSEVIKHAVRLPVTIIHNYCTARLWFVYTDCRYSNTNDLEKLRVASNLDNAVHIFRKIITWPILSYMDLPRSISKIDFGANKKITRIHTLCKYFSESGREQLK